MAIDKKAIFGELIEQGFNSGNLDALDSIFAPGFLEHQDGMRPPNGQGVKNAILALRGAFPDMHLEIEDIIEHEDKTWARITARGTHRGSLMGEPATGKSYVITVIDICRFEGDRISEHWGIADQFSLMRQLGMLQRPQAA
jgi:predicted ester cyclase